MGDTTGVEAGAPSFKNISSIVHSRYNSRVRVPDDAMYGVTLVQEELRQVGAVLPRDPGNESNLPSPGLPARLNPEHDHLGTILLNLHIPEQMQASYFYLRYKEGR